MSPALERLLAKLRSDVQAAADPYQQIGAFIAIDAAVEAEITQLKARILASAIAWGDDGRMLANGAQAATRTLGEVGVRLSERCEQARADDAQDERLLHVILLALANLGSAARWNAMLGAGADVPAYPAMHTLYSRAERLGMAHASLGIVRDGKRRSLAAESHYLRCMLLPIFCHESLDPQQLEIVDGLLWTWVDDYRLTREVEGSEPRLWVDLKGTTGVSVRQFMPEGEDVRHLVVAKLGPQLRMLASRFHAGQLPAIACAPLFPIDAHAGVVDHLQMMWDQIQHGAPKRRHERQARDATRVEAMIGLDEILGIEAKDGKRETKWMRVRDESAGGAGLTVERELWDQIWHGDLVGLRENLASLPRVGVVVRKFVAPDGTFALGIEWIACTCRKIMVTTSGSDVGGIRSVPALYVAADDESGRCDTIVLDEDRFRQDTRCEVAIEDRKFDVRLNRLLRRGRGWVAAGYEITGVRRGSLVS